MSPSLALVRLALAATVVIGASLPAQRGRQRPEAILARVACFLANDALPAADKEKGQDRLANVATVKSAKDKRELALLYLVDLSAEAPKREPFEQIMFGNEEIAVSLRCFHVARLDLAGDADLLAKYGHRLPVFVAFDDTGKLVGEAPFTGYKAAAGPLMTLLEKAAAGHMPIALGAFTSAYRSLVHDLEMVESKRKTLTDRQQRATDKTKREAIDKEIDELGAEQQKLEAKEKEMLERAKLPVQDPNAKRFEVKRGR